MVATASSVGSVELVAFNEVPNIEDSLTLAIGQMNHMHAHVKECNQKASGAQVHKVTAFGQSKFHVELTDNSQLAEVYSNLSLSP